MHAMAGAEHHVLPSSHDPLLVVLSILIATLASFTALDLGNRIKASSGTSRIRWLIGGAFSLGIGIWSMHFTAMLAFDMTMPISYDVPIVALSVLVAVAASAWALHIIARERVTSLELVGVSTLLGGAIAGMHYLGTGIPRPEHRLDERAVRAP